MPGTAIGLDPIQAYDQVMLFAQRQDRETVLLAMHAAVPEAIRADLLHLLRLNFMPMAPHITEAYVLLSDICRDIGGGYYQFDPEVRRVLIDSLIENYDDENESELGPRLLRVARFLLSYAQHQEKLIYGTQNALLRDYLEIQRWVALSFLKPHEVAEQLAQAVSEQEQQSHFVARLQLGGLASTLSMPLIMHHRLLSYIAGLQALESGEQYRAARLFNAIGDEPVEVGGVVLTRPSQVLAQWRARHDIPEPPPTTTSANAPPTRTWHSTVINVTTPVAVRAAPGIAAMRVAELTRTVTIAYDPDSLTEDGWIAVQIGDTEGWVLASLAGLPVTEGEPTEAAATAHVFLSYSREDSAFVERLRRDLEQAGIHFWIDRIGLKAGTRDWEQALRDAIRDAQAVVLVASPASQRSNYVRGELAIASTLDKPIYPLWAAGENWMDSSIPLGYGTMQYLDARTEDNYQRAVAELVRILRGQAKPPTVEPVVVTRVALPGRDEDIQITGTGYEPTGSFREGRRLVSPINDTALARLIKAVALNTDAELETSDGGWEVVGDATEGALLVMARKVGWSREQLEDDLPRIGDIPYTAERRARTTIHRSRGRFASELYEGASFVAFTTGAPDRLIEWATTEVLPDGSFPLTEERRQAWHQHTANIASDGLAMIGVAYRALESVPEEINSEFVERDLSLLGLIGLTGPAQRLTYRPPDTTTPPPPTERDGFDSLRETVVEMVRAGRTDEALALARQEQDEWARFRALETVADAFPPGGTQSTALRKELEDAALSVADENKRAEAFNSVASLYIHAGEFQQALSLYERALLILREVDDRAGEATTLNNLGQMYRATGQPERALELFERALLILREVDDRAGEAATLSNIAAVYQDMGQSARAQEFTEAARAIEARDSMTHTNRSEPSELPAVEDESSDGDMPVESEE
jgi:hypothetical protein